MIVKNQTRRLTPGILRGSIRCGPKSECFCAIRLGRKTTLAIAGLFVSVAGLTNISPTKASEQQTRFFRFDVPRAATAPIVDFSSLNAPLTVKDRLVVCEAALCRSATMTPVRLFGVNLLFGAALPNTTEATQLAARLRSLGVNFVRLHGLDSISPSNAGDPNGLLESGPFPSLNLEAVGRLRNFLEQLRRNGIYADLNLHVVYQFRPVLDKTLLLDGSGPWPDQSKPFLMIDDAAIQLQANYARSLVEQLRGAGEPALALVEINNESSLVYHWMDGTLNRLVTGQVKSALVAKWRRYCEEKGIVVASDDADIISLGRSNSLVSQAFLQFLTDEDKRYVDTISSSVKTADSNLLVIGTQMNFGSLANFQSLSGMDALDAHFYVDQYRFPSGMWRWDDWQITDRSNIGTDLVPLTGAAFYRSYSKPFLITEFNQPWPNRQAAEILPETAAFASMQDWSGLTFHDYSQSRQTYASTTPREFSLAGDAAKLVQFGQAAWIFRTGAISRLEPVSSYSFDDKVTLDATRARITDGLASFLEQHRLADASRPFSARVGYSVSDTRAVTPKSVGPESLTPEARFDLKQRQLVVNAPMVKGVTGYLASGRKYDYGTFQLTLGATARGFVSLTLSSRDGRPVDQSRSLLLTLPGYTVGSTLTSSGPVPLDVSRVPAPLKDSIVHPLEPTLPRWSAIDPTTHRVVSLREIQEPIWMERIPCTFSFVTRAKTLRVFPLDASGHRMANIAPRFIRQTGDHFEIDLQADQQAPSPWFELEATYGSK